MRVMFSPDHPVYILYSSGTTGKPKCIVHSAAGTLIQHKKEHVLHVRIKSYYLYSSHFHTNKPSVISAQETASSTTPPHPG